ncbi:MAG: hypothetical protein WBN85_08005 [Candidatus Macondimonas sp.]|jgi:hypothetical protein
MRKFVALILLVLMPLQLIWAADAVFCSHHEQGAAAQHIGYHADGTTQDDVSEGTDQPASPLSDAFHDHHHHHGPTLGIAPFIALPTFARLTASLPDVRQHATRALQSRIERPKWPSLA